MGVPSSLSRGLGGWLSPGRDAPSSKGMVTSARKKIPERLVNGGVKAIVAAEAVPPREALLTEAMALTASLNFLSYSSTLPSSSTLSRELFAVNWPIMAELKAACLQALFRWADSATPETKPVSRPGKPTHED